MSYANGRRKLASSCVYCGTTLIHRPNHRDDVYGQHATMDHVHPKSLGGCLAVPACRACNDAKGSQALDDFLHMPWLFDRRRAVAARQPDASFKTDRWFRHLIDAETLCS